MNGEERRKEILNVLRSSDGPVSGSRLSKKFKVSRQVIVQDIALLRAADCDIVSTNKGYVCSQEEAFRRVFKVCHGTDDIAEEMNTIVDLGGNVMDVFVHHRVYGELRADMEISSRRDVEVFIREIRSGKSTALLNITSGYHYHTVTAKSEKILDLIEQELENKGFLVPMHEAAENEAAGGA